MRLQPKAGRLALAGSTGEILLGLTRGEILHVPVTPPCADSRHQAMPREGITLSDREVRGERAPSRRYLAHIGAAWRGQPRRADQDVLWA